MGRRKIYVRRFGGCTVSKKADVCLILEGTYPYVTGGVSTWTHELISRQSHLTFHIVAILSKDSEAELKFDLPDNVVGVTDIKLQELPVSVGRSSSNVSVLKTALNDITVGNASLDSLESIISILDGFIGIPGQHQLLDSEEAWQLLVEMYEDSFEESSFLDYFWSWRGIAGSLYSVLLADLPEANVYHALSTGYAGLVAARAKIETDSPVLITEHGIYTNERRIEIASAEWIDTSITNRALTIDKTRRSLRDLWIDTFTNYSKMAYESADEIITLFAGNQEAQLLDGADAKKMHIVPNGVDTKRLAKIKRQENDSPIIALIGRVVPIKDIKSFIRSCAILRERIPDLKAYIMGDADEDELYFEECMDMVSYLSLEDVIEFTGQVNVEEYLGKIDVLVITSISEAQPLVILEAGAAGIPCVATNVGACKEMLLGDEKESPKIGDGGIVVPLSNPLATAEAVYGLLSDKDKHTKFSKNISKRIKKYYTKEIQHDAYKNIYEGYVN